MGESLVFTAIARVGDIAEGAGNSFLVNGRMVAVFLHRGNYHAIDDHCPHMGASLGAGSLDCDGAVMCPWHAWRFDVTSGKWCDNPRLGVDTFETRIVGDEIQVAVPPREENR